MVPPASPRLRRRTRLGIAAVCAVLFLGACTGRPPVPTKYGDTTRNNFRTGCLEESKQQGLSKPADYCTCAYAAILKDIPFSEFKKINSDLSDDPGPLPAKMQKIRDDCVAQVGE